MLSKKRREREPYLYLPREGTNDQLISAATVDRDPQIQSWKTQEVAQNTECLGGETRDHPCCRCILLCCVWLSLA